MARYTSNRFKDIIIGLSNYSELKTALQVVGRVGIGTNDAKTPLWIEGNTNIAGIVTATVFKKEGGTNSQFLMADGSINNLSYLTEESDTLDDVLGRGNSSTKNLSVGVITATSIVGIASTAILANTATTAGYATSAGISTISEGLTGTPSIVVDQITANNVSVAQTLTYEDVTSVDSVGMVTARMGIHIGPITAGVATVSTDGNASFTGSITATSFVGSGGNLTSLPSGELTGALPAIDGSALTGVGVGTDGSINTTGIITATSFVGSGASLTDLPAGELTGTVADARISSLTASKLTGTVNEGRITQLTASKLTGPLPAISGANLTNVYTTDDGGRGTDLVVTGISSLGIATSGDSQPGKTDLYYQGDLKLKTTQQGVEVIGIMSATALDFTGATGAFNNDVLLQGATANANWDKSHSILQFFDGAKAVFGSEPLISDLEIYHDGQNSFINEIGTGDLFITTGIGTTAAKVSDGSITLYHQGVERLKTTSSGLIISGSITGSLGGDLDGNAATASDLNIGATQQLVIQTGNNNTEAFSTGTAGQILQSNGSGNAPTWEDVAPADFTGLTLRQDGSIVGTANSVSTVNFTGDGASVVFTDNNSGIATVTISGGGSGASSVMMSMIF